jgi:hypothetical protein
MKHKTTNTLYAYWNEVRRNRVAPRRFEIEPARIADILPDTFILERIDRRTFRFRLAGTRICERFGFELRGSHFLEGWSGDRSLIEHHLSAAGDEGRVALFWAEACSAAGHVVDLEILVLPLIHTGNALDRFLGSVSALEEPDWLGEERLIAKRLVAADAIWPDGPPRNRPDAPTETSPFSPHVRNARIVRQDRRQFRVYKGGLDKGDEDQV